MKIENASLAPRFLFLIGGFGLGNSTRQLAIMEEIQKACPAAKISIATWGMGVKFFQPYSMSEKWNLLKLKAYSKESSNSKYYISNLVFSIFRFEIFFQNIFQIWRFTKKNRPNVIVFDSDYHYPIFLNFPAARITINQAADINARGANYSFNFIVKGGYFISFIMEKIDFWIQNILSDEIWVPVMREKKNLHKYRKIRQIPLIVRKEFSYSFGTTQEVTKKTSSVVLFGGSPFKSEDLENIFFQRPEIIIEPTKSSIPNSYSQMKAASDIHIQGGLSSISECWALKKKFYVYPLKGHWEQFLNQIEVNELQKQTFFPDVDGGKLVADLLIKKALARA